MDSVPKENNMESPMELLRDDFESSEQEIRIKALKRMNLVAEVIGKEETRNNLLPFLLAIEQDDDEILFAIATQLESFVPLIGGPDHASLLMPILENLARVDETVVREAAITSICSILTQTGNKCSDSSLSMVKKLSEGDWFTSRASACGLVSAAYKANVGNSDAQNSIRAIFEQLVKDDTPMVRRAAASNLASFVSVLDVNSLSSEIIVIVNGLVLDEQDSVRQIAAEQLGNIAKVMNETNCSAENCQNLLPILKKSADDRSWRVRHSIAKCFPDLSKALGASIFEKELVGTLNSLLQDIESEVRSQVLKGIKTYAELLEPENFIKQIMPSVSALSQDLSLPVRISMGDACMDLAPLLKQEHVIKTILPMLHQFLRDENAEVRLHILTKLESLADIMPTIAEKLLPLILELGKDNIWRVRKAVVMSIPMLAERLGVVYFEQKLMDLYLQCYKDSVNDVRIAASDGLRVLCKVCGSDWILSKMLPNLKTFYEEANFYLHRITIISALKTLLMEGSAAAPALVNEVINFIINCTEDPIPNVRFTSVRALQEVVPSIADSTIISQVQPCLTKLANEDADNDVKFFASQALLVIKI